MGDRSIEGFFSAMEDYETENLSPFSVDDGLSPLQRLENYIESENLFSRQMAARSLLETLQQVSGSVEDTETVFRFMNQIAADREGAVRAELVEHIPQLMVFSYESNTIPFPIVKSHIVQILTRALSDVRNQVRKTAQAALSALQEQEFLDAADLEVHVCPILLDQTNTTSTDDVRTEATSMICKLAPIVGQEVTVNLLLTRFAELCADTLLHVRKVCATHFGEISAVVGAEYTESQLLDRFSALCEDAVWGVRKVCAECFMQVSVNCSLDTRKTRLSPLFVALLSDQSRWVRMAAYQALGGFISTFANSEETGLSLGSDGALVYHDKHANSSRQCNSGASGCSCQQHSRLGSNGECSGTAQDSEGDAFNSFRYWQSPLPVDIPDLLDVETLPTKGSSLSDNAESSDSSSSSSSSSDSSGDAGRQEALVNGIATDGNAEEKSSTDAASDDKMERRQQRTSSQEAPESSDSNMSLSSSDTVSSGQSTPPGNGTLVLVGGMLRDSRTYAGVTAGAPNAGVSDGSVSFISTLSSSWKQDLVPQQLLEFYCSMLDPAKVQTVDPEITKHCAYNLPAVAFTLGRHNWPCLSDLYEAMSVDIQWKVRRALAFSLHEVAAIVGEEVTRKQLVPVFNNFLKDLDEVRIGVLKHLADFLQLLSLDLRQQYLGRLREFLVMENAHNWRFREELAVQLVKLVDLYGVVDVHDCLLPLTLTLLSDKVAQVRVVCFRVLSAMVRVMSSAGRQDLCRLLSQRLVTQFAEDVRWSRRQIFVHTLSCVIEDACLSAESFTSLFVPALLELSTDPVPNVRLAVAKLLGSYTNFVQKLMAVGEGDSETLIKAAMRKLEADSDRNVREFFVPFPPSSSSSFSGDDGAVLDSFASAGGSH